jgi:hypothetical protein
VCVRLGTALPVIWYAHAHGRVPSAAGDERRRAGLQASAPGAGAVFFLRVPPLLAGGPASDGERSCVRRRPHGPSLPPVLA